MDWISVTIATTTQGIEPVGAPLLELGINGYSVQDAQDFQAFLDKKQGHWDYIDDDLMQLAQCETTITAYLANNDQGRKTLEELSQALGRLKSLDSDDEWGRLECELDNLDSQDWAESWKRFYAPTKLGERLVVCPSWEEYSPAPQEVVITLDPGMAFGTGTHDSTRLCLQLLEGLPHQNAKVLDLGCGSGILAIGALLLGADTATGVDIDQVAVRVAQENAARNGVEDRTHFVCGDLARNVQGKFDIIFANIVADVIISFVPQVKEYLASGGAFLTSGIIDEREEDVLAAAQAHGLVLERRLQSGGWVGLQFGLGSDPV